MPQPIDMQSELGRATMAERVQDATTRAAMLAQQRAQNETDEERIAEETQVTEAKETQSEHIDAEAKRRNPYLRRRKRKKKHAEDESSQTFYTANEGTEIADDPDDHELDVTI